MEVGAHDERLVAPVVGEAVCVQVHRDQGHLAGVHGLGGGHGGGHGDG